MKRSDMVLFQTAMNQRWDVSPEYKEAMVKQLMRIVMDKNSKKREVISAARALLAAEAQNQTDENMDRHEAEQAGNRFLEIAARLGIDGDTSGANARRPGGNPTVIDGQSRRTDGHTGSGRPGAGEDKAAGEEDGTAEHPDTATEEPGA